jgi:hypothetical protein
MNEGKTAKSDQVITKINEAINKIYSWIGQ